MKKKFFLVLIVLAAGCFSFLPAQAADKTIGLSDGQTIYVPAYSHIYGGNDERPFLLTVTLSIRNTDPVHKLSVTRVDYYETQGKPLKTYITKPIILKPLGTVRYVIPEHDTSGGSGANFIVQWEADKMINPPIVETIMISTRTQQGVSFTSRGREIIPSK